MPKPASDDSIDAAVRELIGKLAPALDSPQALGEDVALGAGGLGFDSVRVVELLLACEDRFHVALPAELLTEAPTLGMLVAWVRRARAVKA